MISRKAMRLSRKSGNRDGPACRITSTTIREETADPANGLKKNSARANKFASLIVAAVATAFFSQPALLQGKVSFYRDVLPILQGHCQGCHRAGDMAPMPLET